MNNLLAKTRFYLIGAIEADENCGISWRLELKEKLKSLNINWFDPCDKHFIENIQETHEAQLHIKQLRKERRYDEVTAIIRKIRLLDLSMVDKADALIFYYDNNVPTCGSWEEFFWGIKLKRPVFVIAKNGIDTIPVWMFACLPHHYFYESLDDVVEVLKKIDSGEKDIDSERWRLLLPEWR